MATNSETESAAPIYQISTREAQILGELSGIKLDLEFAREYLSAAIPMPTSKVRFGLLQAAHISYRRAFNRGGQMGLTLSDIESLGPEYVEMHRFHYDQADKLIAHSVNEFEMCRIGVEVKNGKFAAIKTVGVKYAGVSDQDVESWMTLISLLENGPLTQKINCAFEAVADWLKQQTPDDIRSGPEISDLDSPPPKSAAGKTRCGLQHRRT